MAQEDIRNGKSTVGMNAGGLKGIQDDLSDKTEQSPIDLTAGGFQGMDDGLKTESEPEGLNDDQLIDTAERIISTTKQDETYPNDIEKEAGHDVPNRLPLNEKIDDKLKGHTAAIDQVNNGAGVDSEAVAALKASLIETHENVAKSESSKASSDSSFELTVEQPKAGQDTVESDGASNHDSQSSESENIGLVGDKENGKQSLDTKGLRQPSNEVYDFNGTAAKNETYHPKEEVHETGSNEKESRAGKTNEEERPAMDLDGVPDENHDSTSENEANKEVMADKVGPISNDTLHDETQEKGLPETGDSKDKLIKPNMNAVAEENQNKRSRVEGDKIPDTDQGPTSEEKEKADIASENAISKGKSQIETGENMPAGIGNSQNESNIEKSIIEKVSQEERPTEEAGRVSDKAFSSEKQDQVDAKNKVSEEQQALVSEQDDTVKNDDLYKKIPNSGEGPSEGENDANSPVHASLDKNAEEKEHLAEVVNRNDRPAGDEHDYKGKFGGEIATETEPGDEGRVSPLGAETIQVLPKEKDDEKDKRPASPATEPEDSNTMFPEGHDKESESLLEKNDGLVGQDSTEHLPKSPTYKQDAGSGGNSKAKGPSSGAVPSKNDRPQEAVSNENKSGPEDSEMGEAKKVEDADVGPQTGHKEASGDIKLHDEARDYAVNDGDYAAEPNDADQTSNDNSSFDIKKNEDASSNAKQSTHVQSDREPWTITENANVESDGEQSPPHLKSDSEWTMPENTNVESDIEQSSPHAKSGSEQWTRSENTDMQPGSEQYPTHGQSESEAWTRTENTNVESGGEKNTEDKQQVHEMDNTSTSDKDGTESDLLLGEEFPTVVQTENAKPWGSSSQSEDVDASLRVSSVMYASDRDVPSLGMFFILFVSLCICVVGAKKLLAFTSESTGYESLPTHENSSLRKRRAFSGGNSTQVHGSSSLNGLPITPDVIKLN
eukprot:CAMPEP_0203745082 /NCGR_PEP_ID=MMETSP0098-20131031/941_1 /ASSEMBLY_ACC=CAM_ASM_000208 /TAXON_ID=96639 /ORGANISM=" , Strain NY0313808BC1" /LENGTH=949 /DNA_ID=CAMNT_0050632773 /DNA_START=1301 /DNA_END=4150 /DNA_ORIENTATION=-